MTTAHKKRKQPRETKRRKAREWVIRTILLDEIGHLTDGCCERDKAPAGFTLIREVIVHKKPKAAKGKK